MSELALGISIFSVIVAAFSLGWNIYRDVMLKAKVKVAFGVRVMLHSSMPERPRLLIISATNFGPGAVTLSAIYVKNAPLWRRVLRKTEYGFIMHDYANPMSGQLPKKLEMGEKLDLLLPYDKECLLSADCTHIGLTDYFGRTHWAPRSDVKKAKQAYVKAFGEMGAEAKKLTVA